MKKLMIAAAVAAMGAGAFAENVCAPGEEPVVAEPTLVYSFKASVKTTKGITEAAYKTIEGTTVCAPGEEMEHAAVIIRTKDTTKLQGWIYDCTATCETIANGTAVVWDSKRKGQINDAAFTTTFLNVMGKKQSEAEWAWTFAGDAVYGDAALTQTYALTGAGLGKYNTKKNYYTSFSGNFAGTVGASFDLSKKTTCEPSQIWKCTDLTTLDGADTVAYGTWSVKYDSSASKKFAKNGYLKVPSYVVLPQ